MFLIAKDTMIYNLQQSQKSHGESWRWLEMRARNEAN